MKKQIKQITTMALSITLQTVNTEPPQFIKDGLHIFEQITGDPNTITNHFYRANMLIHFQEFDHALEHLEIVLKAAPNYLSAIYNKAYLLKITGKPAEAISYYKKVLEADPNNSNARLGLSHAYLATGNFKEGLPLFEHRLANDSARNYTPLNMQEISGKTIVIANEAFGGLGDWMMMIRFAKVLKDHGAKVIAQAPESLTAIFSLCPYLNGLTSQKKALPSCDKTILLMNLPLSCDIATNTIPNQPYLFADEKLITHWKNKIAHDTNFKIGLSWGEKPQYALIQTSAYGKRSMPLEKLAPLATIPGISFYSLQKVDGLEQLTKAPAAMKIHSFDTDFDESHGQFMDTAALMKNMDLIITLDTAPAHLAGALGVPTWLYLPYAPEFRWMIQRTDTPWYPTMRLFRQHNPGNWDEVVQDMVNALPEIMAQKKKAQVTVTKNHNINSQDACRLLVDEIVGKL